jgi:hypothetical protein
MSTLDMCCLTLTLFFSDATVDGTRKDIDKRSSPPFEQPEILDSSLTEQKLTLIVHQEYAERYRSSCYPQTTHHRLFRLCTAALHY